MHHFVKVVSMASLVEIGIFYWVQAGCVGIIGALGGSPRFKMKSKQKTDSQKLDRQRQIADKQTEIYTCLCGISEFKHAAAHGHLVYSVQTSEATMVGKLYMWSNRRSHAGIAMHSLISRYSFCQNLGIKCRCSRVSVQVWPLYIFGLKAWGPRSRPFQGWQYIPKSGGTGRTLPTQSEQPWNITICGLILVEHHEKTGYINSPHVTRVSTSLRRCMTPNQYMWTSSFTRMGPNTRAQARYHRTYNKPQRNDSVKVMPSWQ